MEKVKEFLILYLKNNTLRNITAFIFDLFNLMLISYCVYISWITNSQDIQWILLCSSLILIFIFSRISSRLRVTNVCPECLENRAIFENVTTTGNTQNYQEYIKGDYWYHSQEVEYRALTKCCFCEYQTERFYWKKQEWQGDLTEEAKARKLAEQQRRLAEEQRKAQTQAIVDAYAEIDRRKRGY